MKKIFFIYFIASLFLTQSAFAQKKEKKEKQTTTTTTSATGMKKDGTPDMRFKKNKAAVQTKTTIPVTKTTTTTTRVSKKTTPVAQTAPAPMNNTNIRTVPVQGQNNSADKVVGTDSKGRTIYQGPRGGHYYINSKGNKEYIKK